MTSSLTRTSEPRALLPLAIGAIIMLIPGVIAFQPVFGGWQGHLPGAAGVFTGVAVVLVGTTLNWPGYRSGLALLAAYLLLGGAVALPATTIAGFVPTLETLQRLVTLITEGWLDLLTVATPAGDFTGPATVPWLAGLLLGALTMALAVRARTEFWAIGPPILWLTTAIAFGTRSAPQAWWLGVALGLAVLGWWVWRRQVRENQINASILGDIDAQRTVAMRGAVVLVATLLAAAAAGATAVALPDDYVDRQVLRDYVAPPMALEDLPSPLTHYRFYETAQKATTLFTVTGLPTGARLRLATMDSYDGTVYNVSQASADYSRVGQQIGGQNDRDTLVQTRITVGEYGDVWLPGFGESLRVSFVSSSAAQQRDGLYFNRATQSLLTTAGLHGNDAVDLTVNYTPPLSDEDRAGLATLSAGHISQPAPVKVPDVVSQVAAELTAEATSPHAQLTAIAEALHTQGYYSDGSDGRSLAGHTNRRISSMLSAEAWIGDDEQYAVAMALMSRQLGIPARVVLGFYPTTDPGQTWQVKGTEAHVWVEAYLDQAGWVSYDPTPDRNRIPKTEQLKPKPKPRVQVDPPPDPPQQPPKEPVTNDNETVTEPESADLWAMLRPYLAGTGLAALLAAPFVAVLLLKRRRRALRMQQQDPQDCIAASWNQVLDTAVDLGQRPRSNQTRREAAAAIQGAFSRAELVALAERVDHGVYAPAATAGSLSTEVWAASRTATAAMAASVPWYRRWWGRISPRSLFANWSPAARHRTPNTGRRISRHLPWVRKKESS